MKGTSYSGPIFYLQSSMYTEQILRTGQTAADQHDHMDW